MLSLKACERERAAGLTWGAWIPSRGRRSAAAAADLESKPLKMPPLRIFGSGLMPRVAQMELLAASSGSSILRVFGTQMEEVSATFPAAVQAEEDGGAAAGEEGPAHGAAVHAGLAGQADMQLQKKAGRRGKGTAAGVAAAPFHPTGHG